MTEIGPVGGRSGSVHVSVWTAVAQPVWQVGQCATVTVGVLGQQASAQGMVEVTRRMQSGCGPQVAELNSGQKAMPVVVAV